MYPNKIFLKFLLLSALLLSVVETSSEGAQCEGTPIPTVKSSKCRESDWVEYKDEKCFKLIPEWKTRDQAEALCKKQTCDATSTLVSLKSQVEQEFVTNFVFNTSGVTINVWTGARRLNEGGFVWTDGSSLDYANWALDSPSNNVKRNCVVMESELVHMRNSLYNASGLAQFGSENGQWRDQTCDVPNFVLCEKLQTWSENQLQQTLLNARKEYRDLLDTVTKQQSNTQKQVDDLNQNPVSIGFVYVQLGNQPEPIVLWPQVQWAEVSQEYEGLFFRVVGGDSAGFGVTQQDNTRRLVSIRSIHVGATSSSEESLEQTTTDWFGRLWSGSAFNYDATDFYGHMYKVSTGEIRPRNQAMRLWKRVA